MDYRDLLHDKVFNTNTWASDIVDYVKDFSDNPYIRAFNIWKMFGIYVNHFHGIGTKLVGVGADEFIDKLNAGEINLGWNTADFNHHLCASTLRNIQSIMPVIVVRGFWNTYDAVYELSPTERLLITRTAAILRIHENIRDESRIQTCTNADITLMQNQIGDLYTLLLGNDKKNPVYVACMDVLRDYMNTTACRLNARIICESIRKNPC